MKKYLLLIALFFLCWYGPVHAQQDTLTGPGQDTAKVETWQINDLGEKQPLPMDTSLYDSHDFNPAVGQINLGHLGSPMRHHLFSQRAQARFLFFTPYQPLLKTHSNTRYIKTRYPFTFLKYATGGQQDAEVRLRVRHSQNVNEKLNFGLDGSLVASKKFYENDRSLRSHYLQFFGSYNATPWTVYANININKAELNELGGIANRQNFEQQLQRYIPGRLENARNILKNTSVHLVQTLSLKKTSLSRLEIFDRIDEETLPPGQRDTLPSSAPHLRDQQVAPPSQQEPSDSLAPDSAAVDYNMRDSLPSDTTAGQYLSRQDTVPPDTTFTDTLPGTAGSEPRTRRGDTLSGTKVDSVSDSMDAQTRFYAYHHLSYSTNQKRYTDDDPLSSFYSPYPVYLDSTKTRDKALQKSLNNTFKLVYANRFARLSAGLDHELINYSYVLPNQGEATDFDLLRTRTYNNTSINSSLSLHIDTTFSFSADARYFLLGFKEGDLYLNGSLSQSLGNNRLTIDGRYHRYEPDYFFQHYHSNYFSWDQPLSKIRKIQAEARFHLNGWKTSFSFQPSLIRNYTYLDTSAQPAQKQRELQLLVASVQKDFKLWKFHSTNKAVFQYTDESGALSVPMFYFYHRFAFRHTFHFQVTGGRLKTQLGWSLYYFPQYKMDDYMPALGMYYRQEEESIGNRPLLNLFANIQIKRTRIFAKLYHLSSYVQPRDYYTAPRYPMSPMMVKFGVSWSFYD
jgi:hypothetical protein